MKIFVIILIFFLILIWYIQPTEKKLRKIRNPVPKNRGFQIKMGTAANGYTLVQGIDLIENQFVYKLFVTDDGLMRLQIDATTASSTSPFGSIENVSQIGDPQTTQGDYVFQPQGPSPHEEVTFSNITLVGDNYPVVPSSTTGSGGTCTVVIKNGQVIRFTIINAGVGYRVGDRLTIYFYVVNSNGVQSEVIANSLFSFQILSINHNTVLNPALESKVWSPWTTVRDFGASAIYGAGEFFQNGTPRNYTKTNFSYYPDVCLTFNDPQEQWLCIMDEIVVEKDNFYKDARLFSSMTILATTSEKDDLRVFHLLLTYRGLGILAAPRGCEITVDLFEIGYTDLFDDLSHARCGDTRVDDPTVAAEFSGFEKLGLPGLGYRDFYAYPCRYGCANIIPRSNNAFESLLWEMASPNGLFRAQFFDSGHFRFIKTDTSTFDLLKIIQEGELYVDGTRNIQITKNASNAIINATFSNGSLKNVSVLSCDAGSWSLGDKFKIKDSQSPDGVGAKVEIVEFNALEPSIFETTQPESYPQCGSRGVDVILIPNGKKLEYRKNAWIIRGITYNDKQYNSGFVNMPGLDLMISISDSGALLFQKDYIYQSRSEKLNPPNHVMTQSAVGYLGTNLGGFIQAEPRVYSGLGPFTSIVGNAPINDSRFYHWNMGNSLACYGPEKASQWEFLNGTIIATTSPELISLYDTDGIPKFYTLWMSYFGLRLFRTQRTITPENLADFQNCLWITPFDRRIWYYYGNVNGRIYNTNVYCRTNRINWPLPTSNSQDQWSGYNGKVGNPYLQVCGQFQVPIPNNSETIVMSLFSANMRYSFRMMSNGRCEILDFKGYATSNTPTKLYDCSNINIGGYRYSPLVNGNSTC